MGCIYLPANNFKKVPSQEQLSVYALGCLSQYVGIKENSEIPNNVKIKNLFDNHVWVYNKIENNSFWVDFGTEDISVAQNDGHLGLVSGSIDKFYGYVDVNGEISINGLPEEISSIWDNLSIIQNNFDKKYLDLVQKLNEINLRIRIGSEK